MLLPIHGALVYDPCAFRVRAEEKIEAAPHYLVDLLTPVVLATHRCPAPCNLAHSDDRNKKSSQKVTECTFFLGHKCVINANLWEAGGLLFGSNLSKGQINDSSRFRKTQGGAVRPVIYSLLSSSKVFLD